MRRTTKVDRREFLRKAGSRSIAVMSLPILTDALAMPALADDQMSFIFEVKSAAGRPGTPASPQHRIAIGGCGTFSPGRVGSSLVGGGTYTRFLFPGANPPMGVARLLLWLGQERGKPDNLSVGRHPVRMASMRLVSLKSLQTCSRRSPQKP